MGGKLASEINMFIDRKTCPNCRVQLPKLAEAMGVKKLNLFFKDGSEVIIENGKYTLKP